MALLQFSSVAEDLLIGGIDARSAENQVQKGFLRDALNTDVVQNYSRKRQGYMGYAGNIPVRVESVSWDDNADEICFQLDSSINLLDVSSSPIVVYGRTQSLDSGVFDDSPMGKWYSGWYQKSRKTLLPGVNTLTIEGTTHGFATENLFVGLSESLSPSNKSNNQFLVTDVTIDTSSYDIDIVYNNTTGANVSAFVYIANRSTVSGQTYVSSPTTVGAGVTTSISIPVGTHQLTTNGILPVLVQDDSTSVTQVVPNSVSIATNGDVTVGLTNFTAAPIDFYVILSAAPVNNRRSGTLSGNTYTITIENPDTAFTYLSVYQQVGSFLSLVQPDAIEYDSASNTIGVSLVDPVAAGYIAYWQYGEVTSNEICVTDDGVTSVASDSRPQMTIWGLDHSEIYSDTTAGNRPGWANHIDSYRISGENRIIAGLGGNLFSAQTAAEAGTDYLFGALYPRLAASTSTDRILAPVLWETGELPARTRGYITGTGLGDNWGTVTACEWDSVVGGVRYDLTIPSLAMFTSAGAPEADVNNIISAVSGRADRLSVTDMGYSHQNGVFDIIDLDVTGDVLSIWVDNPEIDSDDWDDDGCAGIAGVFTDRITLSTASPFIPGDVITSDGIPDTAIITCIASNAPTTTIMVDGIVDIISLPVTLQLVGNRTGQVIPLRDSTTFTTESFVAGDMISYPGIDRLFRIESINAYDDIGSCNVVGNGVTATLTLSFNNTSGYSVGDRLLLQYCGEYAGEIEITAIPSDTTIEFSSSNTTTVNNANVCGHTISVGEAFEFAGYSNGNSDVTVPRRFIPIEGPVDSYELTPQTNVSYFTANDYSSQPFLRSTMVNDTMFLTDGQDEVMKFDGVSLYRAGFPAWQPGVFIQQDTNASAEIDTELRSIAYSAISAVQGQLTVATEGELYTFPIGTSVRLSGSTETYTIRDVRVQDPAGTPAYYIYVDRRLDGGVSGTGTVGELAIYKYYYRLNAVDINNNVVASAVAQSEDFSIQLTANAAVYHKLIGFPAFDSYDYDTIYLQVYRTHKSLSAPFYKLPQQYKVDYDTGDSYIEFTDAFSDIDLTDLDPVSSSLKGQELGIGWEQPPRAQHITSAGNSLVLANFRDYPQLDIQFTGAATVAASSFNGNIIQFRKDSTNLDTGTDMLNRVRYEWVSNSAAHTISGITGSAGLSFLVASTAHGLDEGDWIYAYWTTENSADTTDRPLTYCGWWMVGEVVDADSFNVYYSGSGAGAAGTFPTRFVTATAPEDVPVYTGVDGNYGNYSGNSELTCFQAARRLSLAINASMRGVDQDLAAFETFIPWMYARSGNDVPPAGRLLVRQASAADTTIGLQLIGSFSGFSTFVNDILRASSASVTSQSLLFSSRVLVSYENFPEIFDSPTAVLDSESDSAIDVNPSDGQELTGVIPFFGEAAFGAAQQSGIVVAFKQNSIYLVDVNEKRAGRNSVQRIETEGIGCTAPGSIAVTRNGIMFANEAGIYVLRRNLAVEFVGKYMDRQWTRRVDRDQMDLIQGHHYPEGRMYKLSVPIGTDATENSEVFVYNHTNEAENGIGAWTRYDNHPATGWCNLLRDAFFGTTSGRVMVLRSGGDMYDYQDDNQPINQVLQFRSNDFGISGIRKCLGNIAANYRTETVSDNTELGFALDTEREYSPTTSFVLSSDSDDLTGTGDPVPTDITTLIHNTDRRRGVRVSVQISNDAIYETAEVAGIEYSVALLGGAGNGVKTAAQSQ